MRTMSRLSLFQALSKLSDLYPSMRLGQLVVFAASLAGEKIPGEVSEVADDALFQACIKHLRSRTHALGVNTTCDVNHLAPARLSLLAALRELAKRASDVSFGQLAERLAAAAQRTLYDVEDEDLLTATTWRCPLCGRSEVEIGLHHPLPIRQRAHILPNRLSARKARYKGVKNPFNEAEWQQLLTALRHDLGIPVGESHERAKTIASERTVLLCGECHEEILSEPIYLPKVLDKLAIHFRGKTRVEKILVLCRVLQLGVDAMERCEPC